MFSTNTTEKTARAMSRLISVPNLYGAMHGNMCFECPPVSHLSSHCGSEMRDMLVRYMSRLLRFESREVKQAVLRQVNLVASYVATVALNDLDVALYMCLSNRIRLDSGMFYEGKPQTLTADGQQRAISAAKRAAREMWIPAAAEPEPAEPEPAEPEPAETEPVEVLPQEPEPVEVPFARRYGYTRADLDRAVSPHGRPIRRFHRHQNRDVYLALLRRAEECADSSYYFYFRDAAGFVYRLRNTRLIYPKNPQPEHADFPLDRNACEKMDTLPTYRLGLDREVRCFIDDVLKARKCLLTPNL